MTETNNIKFVGEKVWVFSEFGLYYGLLDAVLDETTVSLLEATRVQNIGQEADGVLHLSIEAVEQVVQLVKGEPVYANLKSLIGVSDLI